MNRQQKFAAGFAAGRIAYALGLIAAPGKVGGMWLGEAAERGGGRVGARALAVRDAAIGAGVGIAAVREAPVRPWLAACIVSDAVDLAATLADRENLPELSVPGTVVVAGAAALTGAALLLAFDE